MAEALEHLSELEQAYLEKAVAAWATLEDGVPLDAIYVLLQARERPRPKGPQGPEPSDLPIDDQERLRAAGLSPVSVGKGVPTLDLPSEGELSAARERFAVPAPVELAEALKEAPFLVLVGEPGAGKSTTLQYLALTFTRRALGEGPGLPGLEEEVRIPVRIDLRTVAEKLSSGETLAIEGEILAQVRRIARIPPFPSLEWIQAQRDNGRLLVLLDGLDEVPTEERPKVQDEILFFARAASDCRIVVATRPGGYASLGEPFHDYEIQPLTDSEVVVAFLAKWLNAWKVEKAEERARRLWETIQRTPALRRLSVTPLTLRMLAEVEAQAPGAVARIRGRAELYQRYVEEVAWERARRRGADEADRPRVRVALERWAWARHVEGLKTERDLRRVLEREPLNGTEMLLPPDDDGAWTGLRRLLREQLGLLAVVGEEWAFTHQTWQEYLVARRLYRAWKEHPKETWRFLRPRLHLPEWQEPLHLLVGLLAEEEAEAARRFVGKVRRAGSAYERHFHRDLRLAVSLAAEIGWLELIEEGLSHKNSRVSEVAAYALGQLGPEVIHKKPSLLDALLHALGDENVWVRRAAAQALGQLGPETPGLLDALLHALGDDDADVRRAAAQALGQLGPEAIRKKPSLLDALLHALGDESGWVRWAAAQALGQLGPETPGLLDALLHALGDESGWVRRAAAQALGQLGPEATRKKPSLLDALLHALGAPRADVRRAAAQALGRLGPEAIRQKPPLLDALLHALGDESGRVRRAAAQALGRLGEEAASLVPRLGRRLWHPLPRVRDGVRMGLEKLLPLWEAKRARELARVFPDPLNPPPPPRWRQRASRALRGVMWGFLAAAMVLFGLFYTALRDLSLAQWTPPLKRWADQHPVLTLLVVAALGTMAALARLLQQRLEESRG